MLVNPEKNYAQFLLRALLPMAELIGAMREAVGPKFDICLDVNVNFKPSEALLLAREAGLVPGADAAQKLGAQRLVQLDVGHAVHRAQAHEDLRDLGRAARAARTCAG